MNSFHKRENCPSSEKLLAFQNNEILASERDKITVHLRFCEFCAAEVEFYARHPQPEESVERAEIPLPLYQLAEALLNKRHNESLNYLLEEHERQNI